MYDQHMTREHQGKTLAHLSAVSDAPRTDSEAGAARSVSNGVESTTSIESPTSIDGPTGTESPTGIESPTSIGSAGTAAVDAGAAYVISAAEDAELDGDLDVDFEVTLREVEKPVLMAIPGFDQMFEEIEDQWQERALCAQTDPEAFFPEKGGSTREAKRICLGCDVKDECLEYALANDERFGIWGGLSERERRRLKRGIV